MVIRRRVVKSKSAAKPKENKSNEGGIITKTYIQEIHEAANAACPENVEKILQLENDTKVNDACAHYCRFLYFLTKTLKSKVCLEIGTWKGMSSACLASGNPEGKVYTIDINHQVYDKICALPNVIAVLQGDPRINMIEKIDILFIDAEHEAKATADHFEKWLPFLNKGAIVMFDDIFLNDSMKNFWEGFKPEGEKFELKAHGNAGFGVVLI